MESTKKRSSTSKDKEEAMTRWGQTPEARGNMMLKPVRLQTQKVGQNETAEEYVSDEGTK